MSRRRALITTCLLLAAVGVAAQPPALAAVTAPTKGGSQLEDGTFEPGQVIVQYDDYLDKRELRSITSTLSSTFENFTSEPIGTRDSHLRLISFDPAQPVADVIGALEGTPGINHVGPNQLRELRTTPNDPSFSASGMWGLKDGTGGADAQGAWTAGHTGSRDVIVAVLDVGVQSTHPDLAANIWSNPDEIAGDNIDNDGNGYIDDVNGWDFLHGDNSVYDSADEDYHGTHVAGTIGAVGDNGVGVPGVNWEVSILPIKFLGNTASTLAMELSALDYILDMKEAGHNIVAINNSWGCTGAGCYDDTELAKINEIGAAGILFVVAAGNSGMDNDITPDYPSSYVCDGGGTRDWDCIVSVTAHNSSGVRPDWVYQDVDSGAWVAGGPHVGSNVDISAPGVDIYSTYPSNTYGNLSGTSMATPHVTGAIALCAAANPNLDARAMRATVLGTATPDSALEALIDGGGMLDINSLVDRCSATPMSVSGTPAVGVNETFTQGDLNVIVDTSGVIGGDIVEVEVAPRSVGSCGDAIRWRYEEVTSTATTLGVRLLETRTAYCVRARVHSVASVEVTDWSEQVVWTTRPGYACTATTFDPTLMTTGRSGTDLGLGDDDVSAATTITASFYGAAPAALPMRISSNGYVSLGDAGRTEIATGTYIHGLPFLGEIWPAGVVAPWFADLDPSESGTVRLVADDGSGNTIVTWDSIPHWSSSAANVVGRSVSFQMILERSSGTITFQYQDATYTDGNVGGTGLTSLDNTAYADLPQPGEIADLSAIQCTWTDPSTTAIVLTDVDPGGTVTGLDQLGVCTTNCATFIDIGDSVTLTATPDAGYVFTGWAGGCSGSELTCTLSPSTNTWVTANFSTTEHTLSVSITGDGSVAASGAISCPGDCAETVTYGTDITLTATASTGQYFTGWGGACADVVTVTCTVTMTEDFSVSATFGELITVSVSRSGDGTGQVRDEGGEIYCGSGDGSCSAALEPEQPLGFRATAADGSAFVAWSDNCTPRGNDPTACDITPSTDTVVTAWFRTTTTPISLSVVSISSLPVLSSLVSSADLGPGETVAITAPPGTFESHERVVVTLYSDPVVLADLTAAADGSLSASVAVPDETPAGDHTLVAYGYASESGVRVALNIESPQTFLALTPARILDTRGSGPVGGLDGSGDALTLQVTGVGGVPSSGVSAVALNVTVVNGQANDFGGFVTVYPCGARPDASNLNFVSGQTVPNSVIAPLSSSGAVCLYVYGVADVLVDVSGYFVSGFEPLVPDRILDTRSGVRVGTLDGSGPARELQVTGSTVPASATAVALNVTVVDGQANDFGGFVTVFPCGTRPDASNLNFVSGQTVPNSVIAPLSSSGSVCLYVYGQADLLVDVSGYFTSGFTPQVPDRILDTRSSGPFGELDGSGDAYTLQVTGSTVPSSATAVALNVTVVDGQANDFGGFVTVFPCDVARPDASNLNFVSGQTVPNSVIAPLSSSGTVCLYVYGQADLLVDVSGHL